MRTQRFPLVARVVSHLPLSALAGDLAYLQGEMDDPALYQRLAAKLKEGETLLVLGAAGGVGLAAIELGKAMGARYADGLERAGLAETALGRDWVAAARTAILQPLTVTLPFREAGYFAASEARAVG